MFTQITAGLALLLAQPAAEPEPQMQPLQAVEPGEIPASHDQVSTSRDREGAVPDAAPTPDLPAQQLTIAETVESLNALVEPDHLGTLHELFASTPHDAGTAGDRGVIDNLARLFTEFGLAVEVQQIEAYLARPGDSTLRVFAPDIAEEAGLTLSLRERPIEGDPYSAGDGTSPGWNAYSASGDVTAPVVYANYGRLEDLEKLKALGVDLSGTIVLARYGGNFRGYKAKYAEAAGAAGLVIFTDPADAGWGRGLAYGEGGGYANGSSIQRGSIKTLDYPGDPLTPFEPAVDGTRRHNPETVGLPGIPVQPIGWDAASEILSRMTGPSVPGGWQGGLPFRYRVTGGDDLRVRLKVEQTHELVKTANVIATLEGTGSPDEAVFIGCHHDAWGYGAGDPTSGLICLVESARAFGELAGRGIRPQRSVVFCAWAAEEQGIIGSVEFVESRPQQLAGSAVAYINLDMAVMGSDFGANASPSLGPVIAAAAGDVPQAGDPARTVLEAWTARAKTADGLPHIGDLGGGSDHIGFLCHLCIPSVSLHAGGAPGVSYHSNYDNLAWYRSVIGDDYEPAAMVTRMTNAIAARLAGEPVMPLDASAYGPAVVRHIRSMRPGGAITQDMIDEAADTLATDLDLYAMSANTQQAQGFESLGFGSSGTLDQTTTARINAELMGIERAWCSGSFDDGRAWYRSGFAAPDATSGYAAWMLPGLRRALLDGDRERFVQQVIALRAWARSARSRQMAIDLMIELNARPLEPVEPGAFEQLNLGSVTIDPAPEP